MTEDRVVFMNGRFVSWDKAAVHLMSHSVARGSAIFEVLSVYGSERGTYLFRLDEHIARLEKTADILEMKLPMKGENLAEAVRETVRRNGVRCGFVKIVGYYSGIAFEILPPEGTLDIAVFVIPAEEDPLQKGTASRKGCSLALSRWRKLDPRTVPVEAKVAANYLNGMMARLEAKKRGFDYAVLADTEGFLAEGGTESVFLVRGGELATPALGNILDSITRKSVLEVSRILGISTLEGKLPPESLMDAEEIFLSGTLGKVMPVERVEGRTLSPVPGKVTRSINDFMEGILSGEEKRFCHWLFPVT